MSRYFTINLNSGTSPGPYTVFYDVTSNGNITTIDDTPIFASGLSLTQMNYGVTVKVPDTAIKIILYNQYCDTSQEFILPNYQTQYPCLCLLIEYLDGDLPEQFPLCFNGDFENGKPVYLSTTSIQKIRWNTAGFWEFLNHPNNYILRSNDADNIPDSSWYSVGQSVPTNTITVSQGNCPSAKPLDNLSVIEFFPTCDGDNDGGISATAIGGVGGWSYSLDGMDYSNTTGNFTSLVEGTYTVYAKDSGGTVTTKTVILSGTPNTIISIPGTYTITTLPSQGNMKYYMATINYNTSQIPQLSFVTFSMRIEYNLSYIQPGTALFNTTNQYITLNGNPQTITPSTSTGFILNGVSPCNATYNKYIDQRNYVSNLALNPNDVLSVSVVWGIDTTTSGSVFGSCYTTAQVGVNIYFENVSPSCNCCSVLGNLINITQPIQIYQP